MRHRLLLLCVVGAVAVLLAGRSTMIANQPSADPTTASPAACMESPVQDADISSSMEPVTSCAGGCPIMLGTCEAENQFCQCPRGPGHCVPCGPFNENWKCAKDF